ncbi:MAG: hypothetical protein EA356_07155 [Geminicoccaceae bacterium]|nr:MAG: hypothetical protein EA356_07155 [Geminicoccaceae bacterium]
MPTDPDDPSFDVAFALSRQRKRLRRIPDHDGIEWLRPVARAVLAQLSLAGWEVRRRQRERRVHSIGPPIGPSIAPPRSTGNPGRGRADTGRDDEEQS